VFIIGIFAGLVIPMFMHATERTYQRGAKYNMLMIAEAQGVYFLRDCSYAQTIEATGFINPSKQDPYTYNLTLLMDGKGYGLQATANLDKDSTLDVWTMDQTKVITHVVDDIEK